MSQPIVSIQPQLTLYRLEVSVGTRNSPPRPAVHLHEVDAASGRTIQTHTLTPEQARELAAGLTVAVGRAERSAAAQ